jgi:5-methylcytosine-specific restriction endonuclease McrA
MTNTNTHSRSGQGRKFVRDSLRLAIYNADRWSCYYCARTCGPNLTNENRDQATLDHIVARSISMNGETGKPDNRPDNLVTCCRRCNTRYKDQKSQTLIDKALAYARARILNRKNSNTVLKSTGHSWRQACLVSHADTMSG